MNWYLDCSKFASNEENRFCRTTPTYEQRLSLIQGLQIWLTDPTAPQNLTEESSDTWAEMIREGLA
jgi:hypothetical protein